MLKEMIGGTIINCSDISKVGFNNYSGTCWNITILSIFLYGPRKDEVQEKLNSILPDELVGRAELMLCSFLPRELLKNERELTDRSKEILIEIINTIRDRFIKKVKDVSLTEKLHGDERRAHRQISITCGKELPKLFYSLFHKKSKKGGNAYAEFFLINILSVIFLDCFITIKETFMQYIDLESDQMWGAKPTFDLEMLESSFGILITSLEHSTGFFSCDTMKFVNNENITDFNWLEFFNILNSLPYNYVIIMDSTVPFVIYYNSDESKYYMLELNLTRTDTELHDSIAKDLILDNNIERFDTLNPITDVSLLFTQNLDPFESYYSQDQYIELLIKTNILNSMNEDLYSYLMILITEEKLDEVMYLLRLKIPELDINVKNIDGTNALMMAIKFRLNDVAKMILEYPGINVDSSELDLAIEYNMEEIVQILQEKVLQDS